MKRWPDNFRVTPNNVEKLIRTRFLEPGDGLAAPTLVKADKVNPTEDPVQEALDTHRDPYLAEERFERKVEKLADQIIGNRRFTPIVVVRSGREFDVRDGHHRLAAFNRLRTIFPALFGDYIWIQAIEAGSR